VSLGRVGCEESSEKGPDFHQTEGWKGHYANRCRSVGSDEKRVMKREVEQKMKMSQTFIKQKVREVITQNRVSLGRRCRAKNEGKVRMKLLASR